MHPYVVFEQVQPFKGFWAQETRVGAVLRVHQQMVLQGRVAHEAFAADVAGEGVRIPAVDPQVLIQLVFVPEGLATVGAFKRTETLPDEKVLQRRVLTGSRGTLELQRENPSSAFETFEEAGGCDGVCRRGHILKCHMNITTMDNEERKLLSSCFSAIDLPAHPPLRDACIEEERHTVVKEIMATTTPNKISKSLHNFGEHRVSCLTRILLARRMS